MSNTHNRELEPILKKGMGHHHPADTCKGCRWFVSDDCSGDTHALNAHCTLTPVTIVYTSPEDVCNHYDYDYDSKVGGKPK